MPEEKNDKAQAAAASQAKQDAAAVAASGEAAAAASSAMAATGEVVEVPKTPDEIAEQATDLGLSGDHATGGNPPDEGEAAPSGPQFQRIWGMDADHTERNRGLADQLHPDASVSL